MELNTDALLGTIVSCIEKSITPEVIQPLVEEHVTAAVKEALRDSLGYNSDFRKNVNAAIADVMPAKIDGLNRFGDLVLKVLQHHVNEAQQNYVTQALEEPMADLLKPVPASMKLSELVAKLVRNVDGIDRDGSAQPTIIVERSTGGATEGYWHLRFDPKGYVNQYSCRFHADFRPDGKCYSLKIDGKDLQKSLLIGPAYGIDRILLGIYAGGVRIELDRDDFDGTYYGEDEEDDGN